MTNTIPLLNVPNEDLGLIYGLFSLYYSDRVKFVNHFNLLLNSSEEKSLNSSEPRSAENSTEAPTKPRTLHYTIINECTCGKCYNLFARNDRVPWRRLQENQFVNPRHGIINIEPTCPVASCDCGGYIYDSSHPTTSPPCSPTVRSQMRLGSTTSSVIEERKMAIKEKELEMRLQAQENKQNAKKAAESERKIKQERKIQVEKRELQALTTMPEPSLVQKEKIVTLTAKHGNSTSVNNNQPIQQSETVPFHKRMMKDDHIGHYNHRNNEKKIYTPEERRVDKAAEVAESVRFNQQCGNIIIDDTIPTWLEKHQINRAIKDGKAMKKKDPTKFEEITARGIKPSNDKREELWIWAVYRARPFAFDQKGWF